MVLNVCGHLAVRGRLMLFDARTTLLQSVQAAEAAGSICRLPVVCYLSSSSSPASLIAFASLPSC